MEGKRINNGLSPKFFLELVFSIVDNRKVGLEKAMLLIYMTS